MYLVEEDMSEVRATVIAAYFIVFTHTYVASVARVKHRLEGVPPTILELGVGTEEREPAGSTREVPSLREERTVSACAVTFRATLQ